ncbi:hypothetical protein FO440_02640 [Mucilaginibacter corticis]|uniref:Uncharacterized protein n=1 Tax=Mucilaginibacter corticis TaxID=2597670 RepID=A0A556MT49_9SPHI|nr:hypothetical protein [Mucilaginibacter corticis]TSJ43104.1 hypothetical protein FO440_02640 [Mucilaginibacter corticis]
MTTIDSALESVMELDFKSREILLEILQKRQVEARRNKMAKTASQTLKEYQAGKLQPLTADEVVKKLNSL